MLFSFYLINDSFLWEKRITSLWRLNVRQNATEHESYSLFISHFTLWWLKQYMLHIQMMISRVHSLASNPLLKYFYPWLSLCDDGFECASSILFQREQVDEQCFRSPAATAPSCTCSPPHPDSPRTITYCILVSTPYLYSYNTLYQQTVETSGCELVL